MADGLVPGMTGMEPNPTRPTPVDTERDPNQTVRVIAVVGLILCTFFQVVSLGEGDPFLLLAAGALLAWNILAGHVIPLYILFVGDLLLRMRLVSITGGAAFRDYSPEDFLLHLFDSLSLVALMAFGFILHELQPKRLLDPRVRFEGDQKPWHLLEPFGGLLTRLPLAVAGAVVVYFFSQQIRSPISPYILKIEYAQTYLTALVLFVLYLLCRTLMDIWSWKNLTSAQAAFYIDNQTIAETRNEADVLCKPGWSRIDFPSAVGGMFLVQMISAAIATIAILIAARSGVQSLGWMAVSTVFVFLTSTYNTIRTSRHDVSPEIYVNTIAGFAVVVFVGFGSNAISVEAWQLFSLGWIGFNATVVVRLSYLGLLDDHVARKANWNNAKPFSWARIAYHVLLGLIGVFMILLVCENFLARLTA